MKCSSISTLQKIYLTIVMAFFSISLMMGCRASDIYNNDSKILFTKTIAVNAGENIAVKTVAGSISFATWDKNESAIEISGNSNAEEKLNFLAEKTQNGVVVDVSKKTSDWFSGNLNVSIKITIPRSFSVKATTSGGDIKLANLNGVSDLNTSGGNIELASIKGSVNCKTSGGDLRFENIEGAINGKTSGGDVKVNGFTGALSVSTSGGNMNLRGSNGSVNASTSGGNISLVYTGENQGINLSTSGGNVTVTVPADFKAAMKLETSGGDVSCELNLSNIQKMKNSKLIADINGGGAELNCHSSGGDISVTKNK